MWPAPPLPWAYVYDTNVHVLPPTARGNTAQTAWGGRLTADHDSIASSSINFSRSTHWEVEKR